jgi:ankyrin repeat protein
MTGDHPPCNRTWSNGSTESTSYPDNETETSFTHLASKWHIDLPAYEEVVAEISGLSAAIISAIEEKNYKIVAGLLKSGADPLAKDDSGWSVFHYAVRAGSKTVMRELLDSKKVKDSRGFDIRDIHGDTALHFASFLGMKAMAKELLKAGCNKDAVNKGGHSPLSIAVNKKQVGIVEVLLDYKAECIPSNPDKLRKIRNDIKYLKSKAA